jgi:hypothetical protein
MARTAKVEEVTELQRIEQGTLTCYVVGMSPLWMNRMSEKAKRTLLLPSGRASKAEQATRLKHDPVAEFRASVYKLPYPEHPAGLAMMATAFKKGMMTAALDMQGARKAQIGRLTYVVGDYVPIWGLPKLGMAIVRSADMGHTPDVRTRAILPRWASALTIKYARPMLTAQGVANLLASAGLVAGAGDWRVEKGSGNFGLYRVAAEDDPELVEIMAIGREAQLAALDTPECYDDESAEMLAWFDEEVARRQRLGRPAELAHGRAKKAEAAA